MDKSLKKGIWQQFGAAIDMFENAINACPDELWTVQMWEDPDDAKYGQFWYIAYHTLSWLDLFLTGSREGFQPPAPFIRGKLPENPYTKADVSNYLQQCRSKAQSTIESLTDETAYRVCVFEWMEPTFLELQLYSMRHVQEHAAQLNLVLGQNSVEASDWVAKAGKKRPKQVFDKKIPEPHPAFTAQMEALMEQNLQAVATMAHKRRSAKFSLI